MEDLINESNQEVNGGTVQHIEVIEHEEVKEMEIVGERTPIKEPFFIGMLEGDKDFYAEVEKLVLEKFDGKVETAIISGTMIEKMREVYYFESLGKVQREQLSKQKLDKERHKEALNTVNTIIDEVFELERGDIIDFKFDYKDLKDAIFSKKRNNISNKEVENLLNFLIVHNFVMPLKPGAIFVKQEFVITIDPVDRLAALQERRDNLQSKINELQNSTLVNIDNEIAIVTAEINTAVAEQEMVPVETKQEETHIPLTKGALKLLDCFGAIGSEVNNESLIEHSGYSASTVSKYIAEMKKANRVKKNENGTFSLIV